MESYNDSSLDAITEALKERVRETGSLSESAFNLWFQPLRVIALDIDHADIMCGDEMKRKIISGRFADQIAEALEDVLGYQPILNFVVSEASPLQSVTERFGQAPRENASRPDTSRVQAIASATNPTPVQFDFTSQAPVAEASAADSTAQSAGTSQGPERRLKADNSYTFDNFVVSSSNKLAHAAARRVADDLGAVANPLFIWGPSGVGKTHLMYAIANRALEKDPGMNIIFVKGEGFMNEMVNAIQHGTNEEFRAKYRKADILLIDDIQFIAGKVGTQLEFFHTFDALFEDKKQIVLTSDRPPREMAELEDRIRSRFEAGLLADIQPPDYELRLAILRSRISQNDLDVPDDVVNFLAANLDRNIRQLEGVIKKLAMRHLLDGQPINMEMVRETVPEYLDDAEPTSDIVDRIIEIVAKKYKINAEDIIGNSREKKFVTPRSIAMYMVRQNTSLSLPAMGTIFNRSHSTVLSGITKVENELLSDPCYAADIADLSREFHG